MAPQEVEEQVRRIVAKAYQVNEALLTPDTDFGVDLDDSMELVEVILECEELFGLDVPDQDASTIRTLGALVEYVEQRLVAEGS